MKKNTNEQRKKRDQQSKQKLSEYFSVQQLTIAIFSC